jgi:hypothetical protein
MAAVKRIEIIARFLCRFTGEDPDAAMYPRMGFQQSEADRTAGEDSPRWQGFTAAAEELLAALEGQQQDRPD